MSLKEKILTFNPNDLGKKGANIFGLPFTPGESRVVVIPVPWEVTVSYGGGTINGPEAIFEASMQVDLFDANLTNAWKLGVAMDQFPKKLKELNKKNRKTAELYINLLSEGKLVGSNSNMKKMLSEVNQSCEQMIDHVYETSLKWLKKDKLVVLIGGDHSTPLGFMKALAKTHGTFGILQIDAHADLRNAYEGFTYSHASIMFNALKIKEIEKLVQVGIRDYCDEEAALINNSKKRIKTFFDKDLKREIFQGKKIKSIHKHIVGQLPQKVYISFDIDGLDPKLCPNTGTPVPGGLEFEEALHLIEEVVKSGRQIIGLDLNEVSPSKSNDWDANVGSRLLFRMINLLAKSNGILKL